MIDVTTKDLLAKIGALVMENDVLRARIAALDTAPIGASANTDDPATALRPTKET